MDTLLMRFSGPLQSWGVQSQFTIRDTGREPSKSGVLGLLCAALGRPRSVPIDDLNALRMGVRIDREGKMSWDYHITQNVLRANGNIKISEVSTRYYLADAIFLVGLEGKKDLLEQIQQALMHPKWILFLGRKAFPPSEPIWLADGLRFNEILEKSLFSYPCICSLGRQPKTDQLRMVIEDPKGFEIRPDTPISFMDRLFIQRRVRTQFIPLPAKLLSSE